MLLEKGGDICAIAGKVRALEVYLVEITGEHGRRAHGVALGRYREPARRRRRWPGTDPARNAVVDPRCGRIDAIVVIVVVAGGRGVAVDIAVGVGIPSSRLGLRVLPPLSKEPRTAFVQAAKVILGVASPLFAEQHRLVVGDRNRVSPAVAELAIDGDAVIVLVGVFLLLRLLLL